MDKRQLILGDYHTASHSWTLASCKITKAQQVQTFVDIPGRYAPLDLSTSLTDGQPYYGTALLDARLESSEGARDARTARIDDLVHRIDGKSLHIVHPDHPDHYLVGRVQLQPEYNDLAHCAVLVSATCEPWLYKAEETVSSGAVTDNEAKHWLSNDGRLVVVPTVEVDGEVTLVFGENTTTLTTGTYMLPWLELTPGEHSITISGDGTVTFTYREAVLAV